MPARSGLSVGSLGGMAAADRTQANGKRWRAHRYVLYVSAAPYPNARPGQVRFGAPDRALQSFLRRRNARMRNGWTIRTTIRSSIESPDKEPARFAWMVAQRTEGC